MESKQFKSRENPRIKLKLKANLKDKKDTSSYFTRGIITNFSRSGLFIQSNKLYLKGSIIIIRLSLPNEKKPLHLNGTVVSIIQAKGKEKGGMGIKIFKEKLNSKEAERLKVFFDLNNIYGWFC